MKIVFAGSPKFAIPTLERLAHAGHDILAVYTQPDRPVGRGQVLQPPPVKVAALKLGLRVEQPVRIRKDESRVVLQSLQPEVMVVVGYGQILPSWLLDLPRLGCVNLHASLLPAYRGAAPIQWAIANGEKKTGNTTMQMDPGMDTGPILLQWETPIAANESASELAERMSVAGADLVLETLAGIANGGLESRPQDDALATKAPLLKREDGLIEWAWNAAKIYNRLRGFDPWPGIYTTCQGKRLVITSARPVELQDAGTALPPGTVLTAKQQLTIACGEHSALAILEVQPEGRRRMTAQEFTNGAKLKDGDVVGN